LLDEPISALDLRFQHEILGLVRRLTRERNLATLCVLHDLNLAASVADRMLLLDAGGHVVASGKPEAVMTEANLTGVYEVPLRITRHPISGKPHAQSLWPFED
jgi:ABC-type hemin transport system ATPase subunit